MSYVCWFVHSLFLLLAVAFFTLFERKSMGLFHNRLGPNKITFLGLCQPLLDAFKLLTKQEILPLSSNSLSYLFSPLLSLGLSLFMWITLPSFFLFLSMNHSFILFFCIGSSSVFSVLLAGWSSNTKYSLIGSLRSVAQSISYESVFSTLLVLFMCLGFTYSIHSYFYLSSPFFMVFLVLWVICILAETHRAPFDFSESESELVSGFNTEYSGALFAFLFLSEYAILLYSCSMMSLLFFSYIMPSSAMFVTSLLFSFFFTWIRITFCRFRYDKLMMLSWKNLLPISLFLFLVCSSCCF